MRWIALALVGVMSVITTWLSLMDVAWGGVSVFTASSIPGLLALPALVLLVIRPVIGLGSYYFILVTGGLTSGTTGALLWLVAMALLAQAAFSLHAKQPDNLNSPS